ncbi:hypothetical protein [Mycobacterium avium]|uniref:hypothetical protein n=1 Tax=Mycobacterium avium TaxID=1764 RepID=UPI0002D9648F|nr:hypothetical protein [Mycobacterium avium]
MTTINATEADVRAVGEVFQLAAALDPRAPSPNPARVAAWAEGVHRHQLTRDDLLDAVQAFYDSPSTHAINIGDLVFHARNIKRTRLEREPDADRDARRELADAKAEPDFTAALSAAAITGPTQHPTDRLRRAELGLQTCEGKRESIAAIREYFAAKAEARKTPAKAARS